MTEQTTAPTQKRLQILGEDAINNLYGLPHFTPEEQAEYFALSPREAVAINQLHQIKSRIYAILQLGYFKARHLFFVFNFDQVPADAQYIRKRYFPEFQLTKLALSKSTRLNQQRLILELCNYRLCDHQAREALKSRVQQVARVCGKPIYIFRDALSRSTAPG